MLRDHTTDCAQLHVSAGRDLYLRVRAAFVTRDTSLRAWCIKNHVFLQNARDCLLGVWDGPAAKELRRRICEAAGVR